MALMDDLIPWEMVCIKNVATVSGFAGKAQTKLICKHADKHGSEHARHLRQREQPARLHQAHIQLRTQDRDGGCHLAHMHGGNNARKHHQYGRPQMLSGTPHLPVKVLEFLN